MRSTFAYTRALCALFALSIAHFGTTLHASAGVSRSVTASRFVHFFGEKSSGSDSGVGIPMTVATDLARRINRIEKLRERLAHDDGFLRSADEGTLLLLFNRSEGKSELLRGYAPSFGSQEPPADLFKHLDMAVDGLWNEICRLAPTYSAGDGHPLVKDLAQALERRLRVAVPKATFVGGMLRETEWQVTLNSIGVPERRSMSGILFYKLPDQTWTVCREFEVTQRYFDRSSDDGPGEITLGCLRLQA